MLWGSQVPKTNWFLILSFISPASPSSAAAAPGVVAALAREGDLTVLCESRCTSGFAFAALMGAFEPGGLGRGLKAGDMPMISVVGAVSQRVVVGGAKSFGSVCRRSYGGRNERLVRDINTRSTKPRSAPAPPSSFFF